MTKRLFAFFALVLALVTIAPASFAGVITPPFQPVLSGEPLFAAIGDSRAAQGTIITTAAGATTTRKSPIANTGWIDFISGQRVRFPATYNLAVSGSLTSALQGQFNSVLALNPRPAFLEILSGTNDFGAGATAAAAWANYAPIITQARAAGIIPICVFDLTRQLSTWITADANQSNQFNQYIRQRAPALGCVTVNANYLLSDPANGGDPYSGYSPDGIHQTPVSAVLVASQVWGAIQSVGAWSLTPPGAYSVADLFDATTNPYGNLLTNPLFTASGGTNTGTGASGTVPSGYDNRVLTGSATAVSSLIARTDGRPGYCWQVVFTETSGSAGATGRMSLNTDITATSVGDQVYLGADLFVSGAVGLYAFVPSITDWNSGSTVSYDTAISFNTPLISSTNYPMPAAYSGRFRTDNITVNASSGPRQKVRFDWQLAASGAATIQLCAVEARKVIP